MLRRCGLTCAQYAGGAAGPLQRNAVLCSARTHPVLAMTPVPSLSSSSTNRRRRRRSVLRMDSTVLRHLAAAPAAPSTSAQVLADDLPVSTEHPDFPKGDFEWVELCGDDIVATDEEFKVAATQLLDDADVPHGLRQDVRQSGLLPTYHDTDTHTLIVCRMANYGETGLKPGSGWSVAELTDRMSILIDVRQKKVYTIHRHRMGFEDALREHYTAQKQNMTLEDFVWHTIRKLVAAMYPSQMANKIMFDKHESQLIEATQQGKELMGKGFSKGAYEVMRRSGVNSRVLMSTFFVLESIKEAPPKWAPNCARNLQFRRLMARVRHSLNLSDEINNSAKDLLNLHFGTAAHRTNELVKVLTLLNAIFIPLAFLTGFFGMNFEYLPGIAEPIDGVPGICFFFVEATFICVSLVFWFKSRGWI